MTEPRIVEPCVAVTVAPSVPVTFIVPLTVAPEAGEVIVMATFRFLSELSILRISAGSDDPPP